MALRAISDYTVLLPEPNSITWPEINAMLTSRGVSQLVDIYVTTSPTFGRSYLRMSDAIWIISRGVVADDINSGELVQLSVDLDLVSDPVGIATRADAVPTLSTQLIG